MGRGRQKAKQTKLPVSSNIWTTDTDYDELAKELSHHDDAAVEAETDVDVDVDVADDTSQDDLDDYAAWAAQAAKRAEGKPAAQPVAHKPFP